MKVVRLYPKRERVFGDGRIVHIKKNLNKEISYLKKQTLPLLLITIKINPNGIFIQRSG